MRKVENLREFLSSLVVAPPGKKLDFLPEVSRQQMRSEHLSTLQLATMSKNLDNMRYVLACSHIQDYEREGGHWDYYTLDISGSDEYRFDKLYLAILNKDDDDLVSLVNDNNFFDRKVSPITASIAIWLLGLSYLSYQYERAEAYEFYEDMKYAVCDILPKEEVDHILQFLS
jgi:hypothetical protein